jgi:hypothetical protein
MQAVRTTVASVAWGTVLALAACTAKVPSQVPSEVPSPTSSVSAATKVDLYTHCGIRYLQVGDGWFERVGGRLDDGNGNPPSGWGNPVQPGHVTVTGDLALFRDDGGHQESFKRLDAPPSTATQCA